MVVRSFKHSLKSVKACSLALFTTLLVMSAGCNPLGVDVSMGTGGTNNNTTNQLVVATPIITRIIPEIGDVAGGTALTIKGANFKEGSAVYIGSNACANIVVVSTSQITCTSPAGTEGHTDVKIETTDGDYTLTEGYQYAVTALAITGPNNGDDFTTADAQQTVHGTCSKNISTLTTDLGTFMDNDCSDSTWSLNTYSLAAGANTFTITANDDAGNTRSSTIVITYNAPKEISAFSILGRTGTIVGANITVALPYGTNVASLTPTIVYTGASVSPASGIAHSFAAPVTYTVTAADNTTEDYTVTVTVAANDAKDITAFSILGVNGAINGTNITLTLPYGTDATSLTPTIVHTGASVSPASGIAHSFAAPATYTVTAADNTTKDYTVTVTVATNTAKDITAFSILGVNGAINGTNITLTVPYGTDPTLLTPTIIHTGASVSPASGVAHSFALPVTYTVTAANNSTKDYTVTVTVAANDAKDITAFTILGVNGAINGTNIALTLPYGTNVAYLTPTIVYTGASVSPASGVAHSFAAPVTYTVTAADTTTKDYTVTVTVAANTAKDITAFTISSVNGVINGTNITLTLPFGTDVSSLTPTIIHTGASVSPASGVAHSFAAPVTYTVTAADNTTKDYTVTVTVAANTAKNITTFTIYGVNGAINETNSTIAVAVPYDTPSVTALIPTIVHTGASINPASGAAQNFTNPVQYTVTAADASTKIYTVTVTIAPNSAKDISTFTITSQFSAAVINNTARTVTLVMPNGTSLTSLTPTITTSFGSTISPASGASQDFTNPVVYTVTAADTSIKLYTVTVTASPLYAGYMSTFTGSGVSFNLAYIPGGLSFKTGTADNGTASVANAYWIAETAITYELWSTVKTWATSHGYTFANAGLRGSAGSGNATQPVTMINWRDALIWTNALTEWYNAQNGTSYTCTYYTDLGYTTPIRTSTNSTTITATTPGTQDDPYIKADATGFRMLSANEWQLAARYKGSDSSHGAYQYPAGSGYYWTPGTYASGATAASTDADATQAVGWYTANAGGVTHDVKLKTANALGLYDMSGNVWVITFDWYDSGTRALRGGCWTNAAGTLVVGYTDGAYTTPYGAAGYTGFRFARTQ